MSRLSVRSHSESQGDSSDTCATGLADPGDDASIRYPQDESGCAVEAIELRIPGQYWDSFLYNGQLFLFTRDGDIELYDWDRLVSALGWSENETPMATQMLTRGRAWYAPPLQQLIKSPSTARHFHKIAAGLTAKKRTVGRSELKRARLTTQASPLFPHADLEIYKNRAYVSGVEGIYQLRVPDWKSDLFERVTDIPALRMAASYGSLAVAAGAEGLWDQPVPSRWGEVDEAHIVSTVPCQAASWAHFDVVATSIGVTGSSGYLAAYTNPKSTDSTDGARSLIGTLPAEQIFGDRSGYLMASQNRLLLLSSQAIEVETWNPYRRRPGEGVDLAKTRVAHKRFEEPRIKKEVIDAAVSVFGLVAEYDESLRILANDGTTKRLAEPINWRCFQRSTRYVNHLHVTFADHARIYAFVHDYFLKSPERGPSTARPTGPSEVGW